MKTLKFKIPNNESNLFKVQIDKQEKFYNKLHQHHEMQITYIIRGRGSLLMDDYLGDFYPGEIYIIGQNSSHVFRSVQENSTDTMHSISLFFDANKLSDYFGKIEEVYDLQEFLRKSNYGMRFRQPISSEIGSLMNRIVNENGLQKIITFLDVLNKLSFSDEYTVLSKGVKSEVGQAHQDIRINKVFQFSLDNYHRDIKLEEVANIASMTTTSFCKYFKLHTRKTYINFLNELRISQACKLLRDKELNIDRIADMVGFNNIANFNRKFKQINEMTPSKFRKKYSS